MGFPYKVVHLGLITYYSFINFFLNAGQRNSFLQLYTFMVGLGYLHNHYCSTMLAVVYDILSLCYTILDDLVTRCIMVIYFIMRVTS